LNLGDFALGGIALSAAAALILYHVLALKKTA